MKLKKQFGTDRQRLLCAFLFPFLAYTLVMICSGYAPFGSKSILVQDAWHQYYPFFVEFRETLRSGGSLFYNWDIGMGTDYLSLIAYYLASPLNLLSVIVPEGMLMGYFSMLVPVRLGLAGLFFCLMLEKIHGRRDWSGPVFGAGYALCAWALGYNWNIMWLDTFALLPLVIWGMVSLLRERRFILYTLTLALSIACNYYIGFFVCIFVLLCFIAYQVCCAKSFRGVLTDLGLMFVFSFLAITMTAFLELPAFVNLGTTNSSGSTFPTGFALNIADKNTFLGLLDGMRQVLGNTASGTAITYREGLPNVACGLFPLILAIQFLLNGKFTLRERLSSLVMLIFFILSFLIRKLDYIWHGFHFTNMIPYRFSFLFSFVVLVMGYRALPELESAPVWRRVLSLALALVLCAFSEDRAETMFLVFNLVFLGIYVWFTLSIKLPQRNSKGKLTELSQDTREQNRQISWLLLCAMLLELVCSMVNFGATFGGPSVSSYPRGGKSTLGAVREMKRLEADSPYYRAEFDLTQTLNDSSLLGFSGITMFSSSTNVRSTRWMNAMGYAARPNYNRYAYENASPVSNLFLNLKYLIHRSEGCIGGEMFTQVYQDGNVELLRNDAYLPLGFMVGRNVTGFGSEDSDAGSFEYQNRLFAQATGMEGRVFEILKAFAAEPNNGITCTELLTPGSYTYTADSAGSVDVSFTAPADGFYCLDFYVNKRNSVNVKVNGNKLYSNEALNLDQMLSLGDCKAGDVITVEFRCKANETGKITLGAARLNRDIFWKGYEKLNGQTMEILEMKGTRVVGAVTATDESPLLYTSIPYHDNWSATVDGKPVPVMALMDAMVGLELEPGAHEIVLTYKNTAFYQGLVISLTAAAMFAALVLLDRKLRKGSRRG